MPDLADGFVRVAHLPAHALSRFFFDLEVTGAENVPDHGGVVFAANHFSLVDPFVVSVALRRQVRYLALDELYGNSRMLDGLLAFFRAIPTDRQGYPLRALRTAIEHVTAGGAVGVFPEGRRVEYWGDDQPKRGAAWLAWMTGAPLIPVAVYGSGGTLGPGDEQFRRTSVRVWIGPQLVWHDYAGEEDPLGAMMADWHAWVDGRLDPWIGTVPGETS